MPYSRFLQHATGSGRTAALRVLRVAAAVLLVATCSVSALANTRDLTRFTEYLRSQALLEHEYDQFLASAMTRTLHDLAVSKPVKVNETYSESHVNVYAVRKPKRSIAGVRFGALDVQRLLMMVANNGVALPPNLILIDSDLLGLIVVNAFNNVVGLAQLQLNVQTDAALSESAQDRRAWAARAVDARRRFGNIQAYLSNYRGPNAPATLGPAVARILVEEDVTDEVYLAVFTLLGHEVAHLRLNHPGHFASWEGVIQWLTSPAVRQEEERADQAVLDAIKQRVRESQATLLRVQSAVGAANLMRDMALFFLFEGFRGLGAGEVLVALLHTNCLEQGQQSRDDFNTLEVVKSGGFARIPLLSSREFEVLQQRFREFVKTSTHPDYFLRAQRIFAEVEPLTKASAKDALDIAAPLYAWLSTGVPTGAYPYLGNERIGLPFAEVMKGLPVTLEPVVNCPPGVCKVGGFQNHPGYVELVGPPENPRAVRIVSPALDGDRAQRHRELATILRNVSDDKDPATADDVAKVILYSLSQCKAFSEQWGFATRIISLRTLNPDGWVSIDITPRGR